MKRNRLVIFDPQRSFQHRDIVHGVVVPPQPVQILVLSNDGRWYLQADADRRGNHWGLEAVFGFPNDPSVREYTAVAVAGPKIKQPVLDKLPSGPEYLFSRPLKVRRVVNP